MCNFMDFPVEVQEMILSKLSLKDLCSMSKVCRLWCEICKRIAKEKFSKDIPEECIHEIENDGIPQDVVWLTAIKYQYLQKCVTSGMLYETKNVVELNWKHACFCIHGPLIFVGLASGEIHVYNTDESIEPILELKFGKIPVIQIEIMKTINLLLVRTFLGEVAFFSLPYRKGKSWVYKMTILKPSIKNLDNKVPCERNFSFSGTLLALVTEARQVCIFQVTSVTETMVNLKYMTNYITDEPINHVSIWRDEIIVIFRTGGILRWCLSTSVSFLSDRYYELHYENPMCIFRGRIFCSTILSCLLLGYWHMDRGARYWLAGKPACDLVHCRGLGMSLGDDLTAEDVLCVCLKQRLLACGTRKGKILLYYLSDTFFSSDEFDVNGNDHLTREFNRVPDLVIKAKERPINNIQLEFKENSIIIYTWPCRTGSRLEVKCLFQCIVLTDGGTKDQEKDNV